jgi:hypothetical protein
MRIVSERRCGLPILRFSKAIELARNVKALLNLESGVTRGTVCEPEQQRVSARKLGRKGPAPLTAGGTPDFVIIGAQKCGTTFLYDLLSRNPHIEPAAKKEVHFFDRRFGKGVGWYWSHFPPPTWKEGQRSITGEATPYYLFHPHAARRMAEVVPQARLIVLLRDPVDRAYSGYHHQVRAGHETLGFEEAIETEETRLRGERARMLEDEQYASFDYQHFSYLSRGVYVDQLVQWSKFFGRDQMLVLKSEDLFDQVPHTLQSVLEFLCLPSWRPETSEPRLKGSYPPMNSDTRQRLRNYFEPHNQRLYEYLGVDLGW